MDIGSGLTVETRTVNGKLTTGIFLSDNLGKNARSNSKTKPKYPIRSKVDPDEKPKTRTDQNGREAIANVIPKNQQKRQQQKPKNTRTGSGKNPPTKAEKVSNFSTAKKGSKSGTQDSEKSDTVKKPNPRTVLPTKRAATKPKGKENVQSEKPAPEDVNTKYVTLTQGQLSTILGLVKSKNEIDISGVLEDRDGVKGQQSKVDDIAKENQGEKDQEEPHEDNDESHDVRRPSSQKSSSAEDDKVESIANLLNGDPKKSKKRDKSREIVSRPSSKKLGDNRGEKKGGNGEEKDKKKGKVAEDSDNNEVSSKSGGNLSRENTNVSSEDSQTGRNSQDNLPAAIRSSFFLGEAAPREHAFSAKKRAEQQRWREELDKQRIEQQEKREQEKNSRLKLEELDSWTKHFDTMLPTKTSPRNSGNLLQTSEAVTNVPTDLTEPADNASSPRNLEKLTNKNNNNSSAVSSGAAPFPSSGNVTSSDFSENREFASTMTNNAIPQRSTYLRTMTSLLDPAQIEALEVKRRKQEEHRRAIEAQVQERRRKKEEEEERRRQLEAEEDLRLAADRDSLAQKTELEKLRHQMQENLREQKTRELYQQMKNAEESALRDKLSKREQVLKNKGHDTSRLERTHQMTLEMSHKMAEQHPLAQASQTSIASNSSVLPAIQIPQDGYVSNNVTPRQAMGVVGQSAPVAVTAQTEQGPIKLEISLNQKRASELVESAVQTDHRFPEPRNLNFDSDTETEYLQLPEKRQNAKMREKNKKLQNFEKSLDRQYDRHSRTDRGMPGGQPRSKKNGPRPKWGVGEKNKSYVPASQRYTTEQQKHDTVMRKREERSNVVNEPERAKIRPRSPRRNQSEARPKSPPVPAISNRQKNEQPKRQTQMKGTVRDRPSSGIYATTEQAKYRSEKHSRDSPVPETKDFVQYRRTTAVLNPNQPQSRPETGPLESRTEFLQRQDRATHPAGGDGDPLLNPDMVRQHERQEQILKEISILRQGLLIKQREVASYPAAMTHSMAVLPHTGAAPTNFILARGGNLPERTNDTPVM